MSHINFFVEEIPFTLNNKRSIRKWISQVVSSHGQSIENLNYIFCSDQYLHSINTQYLDHDTYTDIITFDNSSEQDQPLEADIFISIDRVRDNSKHMNSSAKDELHRVMIHGVLHLLGYKDKTPNEKKVMREKEEVCLSLLR